MNTRATTPKPRRSPLLYPAVALSLASLAWTTWSLVDLLGTGWIGFTVAAGSDIIWGSVIIAEARGLRIAGRPWIVPALGWATLLVVAVFLAGHGIVRGSLAMAAAGPFLPLGAKIVWALALADMRDPATLTHEELHQLARMERGMVFEEREHDIRMRQQRMRAELLMSEVSTDFDIEVMRQDRVRDLRHRAPLAITGSSEQPFDRAPEQAINVAQDTPSGRPDSRTDSHPDESGLSEPQAEASPLTSQDTHPDSPDALSEIAKKASGPSDLVRALAAHGVPKDALVSEAVRLRPDMVADSIRRTAKRLGEGPYL